VATVRRVVAPNPGPFTGPGTNTWILGDAPAAIVIDPGPDDDAHLEAVARRLGDIAVGVVLLTHGHADHAAGAARFARAHGARLLRHPELADGDAVHCGGVSLTAVHTPGHAPDHVSLWMPEDRVLFCGDLVLGRGSSMVSYPEGDVAAYLRSLDRVAELGPRMLFPGHWDPVADAMAKIAEYRAHRLEREAMVVAELAAGGPVTAVELTRRVYRAELEAGPPELERGAEATLRAHLRKLVDEGRARVDGGDGEGVYRAS
jgi:glyoxylase-like metal-dependent hydrolase (beta-lactamase superfamily II)